MSSAIAPTVSIGLPVYNGERYLRNALERLLAQEFRDFELIICDNASRDQTQQICREYAEKDNRIRYFRNPENIGLAANHNRTFELARGPYFKWAAYDDDFPESMLSGFVKVLNDAPSDICAVYSCCEYIDDSGFVQAVESDHVACDAEAPHRRLAHLLANVHMFNSIYGLMRSDIIRRTGLLGRFPMSDQVLLAELAMLGKLIEIPRPLLRIRRHMGRTFSASSDPRVLRELFAPGEGHRFPRIELRAHMWWKLIGAAARSPISAKDRLLCTAVAAVTPQWRRFRAYLGRRKREFFRRFSSVQPAYRAGDWVTVKSKEEILATLDSNGCLERMPFMPEMFAYCGQRLRVYKRAHKTCDTVDEFKARKLTNAVHLEGIRCNGRAHGGCQAACMIFWKTAWLRTLDKDLSAFEVDIRRTGGNEAPLVSEEDVVACARKTDADDGVPVYACQATELPAATQALGPWDLKQYVEDFASGNVGLWRMLKSFLLVAYRRGLVNLGIGLGPALKWMYDKVQGLIGGVEYPFRDGKIPAGSRTPTAVLELKPGELVRVKTQSEIVATLDTTRRNRGMTFDPEMVPYCGGTFPVLQRVTQDHPREIGENDRPQEPLCDPGFRDLSGALLRQSVILPACRISVLARVVAGPGYSRSTGCWRSRE